jgi:hypothetical protein
MTLDHLSRTATPAITVSRPERTEAATRTSAPPLPLAGLSRPRPGADATVRRRVSVRGRPGADKLTLESPEPAKLADDEEELIAAVDAKTAQAWGQVVKQPLFSKLASLRDADGHIRLWTDGVHDLMTTGKYPGLAAAEFGYAVESLCTHLLGSSAAGWSLEYQVAAGRTRPDIVARKDGRTMWLDLTAGSTGSEKHIYTSKAWHMGTVCPYPHAEVTYQVLDLATQGLIAKNAALEDSGNPVATDVDPEALDAEVKAAQQLLAARLEDWKKRFPPLIRQNVRSAGKYGDAPDRDARARKGLISWLNTAFGTALDADALTDLRTAGSVLVALGMGPETYGFVTASVSRAAGVAYLQANDPKLLQPEAPATPDVEMGEV